MRVIVWGINYTPEQTGIAPYNAGLCEYLAERGHDVEMVTTFAYYPAWKKLPEDKGRLYRTDRINGVTVHRCWHYVPPVVSTLKRMVHEATFCITSTFKLLTRPAPDVYFVVSPPLALGFFAWIASRIHNRPYVFHVQDLQPDAALSLGMVKKGPLVRLLFALEKFGYDHAATVSGISAGMIDAFTAKGVPAERRAYLPNWMRSNQKATQRPTAAQRAATRSRYGVGSDELLAFYSGNIGRKQGLDVLVEAAELLQQDGTRTQAARAIRMIIAGDGAGRPEIEARLAAKLLKNVTLLPLLDEADYAAMLAAADVALITQAPGTGQFFFPSKLLSVLAAGLPVITAADDSSELAKAVHEGGFGKNVPAGGAAELAHTLTALTENADALPRWRENTRWIDQFSPQTVLPATEKHLTHCIEKRHLET